VLSTFLQYTKLTEEETQAFRIIITHLFIWKLRQYGSRSAPVEEVRAKAALYFQRPDTTDQPAILLDTPTLHTNLSPDEASRFMLMLFEVWNDLCYFHARYLQATLVSDWDKEHLVCKEDASLYGSVLCGAIAPRDDEFGWILRPLIPDNIPKKPALKELFCPLCLALWKQSQTT
jgi:hypothetical protein